MRGLVRLGDLLQVQNGFAFPSDNFVGPNEGFPLIRIRDLGTDRTQAGYRGPFRDEFVVYPGDLLIGMDGDFECFRWNGPEALLNQRVCRLRHFSEMLDEGFLFHWIGNALRDIHSKTSFVTVKHISSKQINDLNIPLPPLDEQRRIVGLLDRAAEIRRRADAARAKARAIIPALFLNTFGDPATNPKGWPLAPLGVHADVQGGVQVSAKRVVLPIELPYLRVANVMRGNLNLSEIKTIRVNAAEARRAALAKGDVLIVEGHGNPNEIGRAAIWDGSISHCIHQNHLIRARPSGCTLTPEYLETFLNSEVGRRILIQNGKTTSGLNTISTRNVKEVLLPLPPLPLQTAFAEQVHRLESLAHNLDAAAAKAAVMAASLSAEVFG